ncbi:CAP domain-containing protein [Polyangium aurulentum]|uniref:CAP domain-containing protein n=1 Tax=Polyangium aurulentum TaxID=2567896 RepID=UPI0010ADBC27|nr:CAP domain-containing protein [Polyangium aurulentum]UQA55288.1 hypothetical protein E8A73_028545 [Polyangium aurulentum]
MPQRFLPPAALLLGLALLGCSSDDEGAEGDLQVETGAAHATASTHCVEVINEYRASIGLPAYERWADGEACADGEAKSDAETGKAHGAFPRCGESAQNECPGWNGAPETMIDGCLEMMWNEGPGEDFSQHGHYLNMSNKDYKQVACGFFVTPSGSVWSVQNFK